MRITNSMMRTNSLWNINKNEELMNKYGIQLSTGKKIQKPSDDPIVAVRALKLRTNVKEIVQYKTNSQDAISWLGVTEQAMNNTTTLLKRARDLCVQGASDTFSPSDRANIIAELSELKEQFLSEANVNYAGRYIFSGFKTDKPVTLIKAQDTVNYEITESMSAKGIEKVSTVVESATPGQYEIKDSYRLRLGYGDIASNLTGTIGTLPNQLTVNLAMSSTDPDAYNPAVGTVNFLEDTGELVFNVDNVNGEDALGNPVTPVPTDFDIVYNKIDFQKGDLAPEQYYNCINTSAVPPIIYTKPKDEMVYQISYNQQVTVNSMGNEVFTADLARDFDEIINAVKSINDDDPEAKQSLQKDVLGNFFEGMLTKLDKHLNTIVREQAVIGSKINRLELTINRLDDDKVNFTELLSLNENVDMTEAVLNLKAQEIVYNASLAASSKLMQKTLMDFIN
ncbi:MAG: flagellar hook-associated protein 3 [Firmicutes bacterium HGW-Firmicutes-7]|nr:MAG: flagellar hook-associated protein 3 [Firmicutes bacterium HGW-Firmicutes-7]